MSTTENRKQRALRKAARFGKIEEVREYLNDSTIDMDGKDFYGFTTFHEACCRGYRDIAELMLCVMGPILTRDRLTTQPLSWRHVVMENLPPSSFCWIVDAQ